MLPDGAVFRGKSASSKSVTGMGTLVWPDQSTYEGQIKKGQPHGFGTKTWLVDETKQNQYKCYHGNWVFGKMEGHGELVMSQGEIYIGEFQNGYP